MKKEGEKDEKVSIKVPPLDISFNTLLKSTSMPTMASHCITFKYTYIYRYVHMWFISNKHYSYYYYDYFTFISFAYIFDI